MVLTEFHGFPDSMFNASHNAYIKRSYDPSLIALSVMVSLIGSLTAVYVMREYPMAKRRADRFFLISAFALSISGNSVWAMHVVGIFATELTFIDEVNGPIQLAHRYYIKTLALSVVPCFLLVILGTLIASLDPFFAKNEMERLSSLNRLFTLREVMARRSSIKFKALFAKPGYMIVGGTISGVAVTAMHYIGVTAKYNDHFTVSYDDSIVGFAVTICIVVITTAYWLIFRLLQWKPQDERYRVASAVFITLGCLILHYVGNLALIYTPRFVMGNKVDRAGLVEVENAFIYAMVFALVFNAVVYMYLVHFIVYISPSTLRSSVETTYSAASKTNTQVKSDMTESRRSANMRTRSAGRKKRRTLMVSGYENTIMAQNSLNSERGRSSQSQL